MTDTDTASSDFEADPSSDGSHTPSDAPADVDGRTADPSPEHGADRHGAGDAPTDDAARTPPEASTAPKLTRRGRLRKWDRPPPPHDWRWVVSHVGRVLIAVGLLMFGFVAYQLWGTAIENAQAQRALENDFEELLASAPPVEVDEPVEVAPATTVPAVDEPVDVVEPEPEPVEEETPVEPVATEPAVIPVEDQNIPLVENGDALARIEIPIIGVDDIVVAGVETSDLKKGPGHFPDTPLPGQLGNSAIAGHRTTYGQPFHDVDKLEPGDEIRVTTLTGQYVYRVTGQQIVSPSDYQVVATTDPTVANLTLTSCHPKWTARQRIVIFSELDVEASATVGEPVYNYGLDDETDDEATDDVLPGDEVAEEETAADTEGDSSDDGTATLDSTPSDESDTADDESADDAATDESETAEVPADPADDGSVSGSVVQTDDGVAAAGPTAADSSTPPPAGTDIADAFAEGWFSDPGANGQVGLWGSILALIGIGAYLLSRKLRRDWVGALVGIVPFVVALYFFFQNVNRLLPPNL